MMYFQQTTYANLKLNRTAVLFLHAFPLNSKMWKSQIDLLESQHIGAIAFDYPGFGQSSPFTDPPELEAYADVAYSLLRECGVSQVVAVGLSMGGYIALSMYRKYPKIFKGLVLANTRASADTPQGRQRRLSTILQILETRSIEGMVKFHQENFYSQHTRSRNPDVLKSVEGWMQDASVQGVIHALRAMAYRPDSSDLLASMDFPVMVVAGAEDKFIPPAEAQALADKLPKGEIHVLENVGHLSNLEAEDEFNRLLLNYLDRVGVD